MTNKMEGEDRKELERKGEGGRQGGGSMKLGCHLAIQTRHSN